MPASEPVAPSVMFRSGSTFAYPLTQALNSGRIRVEPVSEIVSEAECAANVAKTMPAGNTAARPVTRTMLVRRPITGHSFRAGRRSQPPVDFEGRASHHGSKCIVTE